MGSFQVFKTKSDDNYGIESRFRQMLSVLEKPERSHIEIYEQEMQISCPVLELRSRLHIFYC